MEGFKKQIKNLLLPKTVLGSMRTFRLCFENELSGKRNSKRKPTWYPRNKSDLGSYSDSAPCQLCNLEHEPQFLYQEK